MDLTVSVPEVTYLLFIKDMYFINPIFENIYESLIFKKDF